MKENNSSLPEPSSTGSFDPEKAAALRALAVDTFQSQMKKIERLLNGWLVAMLAIALLAAYCFFASTDTQSWILFGVLFLLGFNSTILLKLWYWIVNNKIGVVREIRLLRLDLAAERGSTDAMEHIAQIEPRTRPQGLSKTERWIWMALILALSLGIGFSPQWRIFKALWQGSSMTSQRTVLLDSSGLASMDTYYTLQNWSAKPLRQFTLFSGGAVTEPRYVPADKSTYRDSAGRPLAFSIEPAGPNQRHVVYFVDPVPAFAQFRLRSIRGIKAVRDGNLWTFAISQNWGYQRNHYTDTVVLPRGAKVISTGNQTPLSQTVRDGKTEIQFQDTLGPNAQWNYEVTYQLTPELEITPK